MPKDSALLPVHLRDILSSDLPIFYEHQLDPDATRMAAFPSRDRETFMAHWAVITADPSNIMKTILYKGEVAGNVVSYVVDGDREVGYWLGRQYWGKGIATRALTLFLGQVAIRPLYAHVARSNPASLRVLQKCGFQVIGQYQYDSEAPGSVVDEFILELLDERGSLF